jgi:hypothetical protein
MDANPIKVTVHHFFRTAWTVVAPLAINPLVLPPFHDGQVARLVKRP